MKWLLRNQRDPMGLGSAIPDKIQKALAGTRIKQRQLADHLQKKSERYTGRQKLAILAVFMVMLTGFNAWLIIHSNYDVKTANARPRISIPDHVTSVDPDYSGPWIAETTYQQIIAYKSYLDSLALTSGGRAAYEKVISKRPGLMDSLNLFERMYEHKRINPEGRKGQIDNPKK